MEERNTSEFSAETSEGEQSLSTEEGARKKEKINREKKVRKARMPENGKEIFRHLMLNAVLPVLVSGILRAFAIYMFVSPNHYAPGGTNGAAVLLEEVTKWNSGYFLLIFSVPLFFLAFFMIGKKEAIVSTVSFFISSVILIGIKYIPGIEIIQYGGGETRGETIVHGLLGAVAAGIILGIALAIMLKQCGTSGGTSIIASIINKRFRNLSVSMLTSVFDAIVVIASIFVYYVPGDFTSSFDPVLLALVSLFVTSKMCDTIMNGFRTAYKFEIVTNDPDALADEIMTKLHHGVTKISAEGMYSHECRSMLVCIIRKRQIAALQRIIRQYPDTFAYFSSTSEVYGRFAK